MDRVERPRPAICSPTSTASRLNPPMCVRRRPNWRGWRVRCSARWPSVLCPTTTCAGCSSAVSPTGWPAAGQVSPIGSRWPRVTAQRWLANRVCERASSSSRSTCVEPIGTGWPRRAFTWRAASRPSGFAPPTPLSSTSSTPGPVVCGRCASIASAPSSSARLRSRSIREIAAQVLADAWLARGPGDADAELMRRLRFAGLDLDLPSVVRQAARTAETVAGVRIGAGLPAETSRTPGPPGPHRAAGAERTPRAR